MFRFEEPAYLYLLLLLPLLGVLFAYHLYRRYRQFRAFGDESLVLRLLPRHSTIRPHVKFCLVLLAIALFCVLLARPQFGSRLETVKRKGIEVMILMDISNSMLCEDVQPSRLEKSKRLVSQLVDKMENDRVGLIVFAGDAFTRVPITSDYISAKMFLDDLDPSLIQRQGTAIAQALRLASLSFTQEKNELGKAVVLITDGENHEDGVDEAVKELRDKGIDVYVMGVGSPEGAPIPVAGSTEYRKDKDGSVVITRLNEQMCQSIAQMGGGAYVRVDNTNSAQRAIQNRMDELSKAEIETKYYSEYDEQFQSIGWMILLLLVVESAVMYARNPFFDRFNLFPNKKS